MAINFMKLFKFFLIERFGLAIILMLYFTFVSIYSSQLPLELHAFRQSQTALTAYWIAQDGFNMAYQTPVAGPPWSIPFEFPLYQMIVAYISKWLGLSLDITGREVSAIFMVLLVFPVRGIFEIIKLNKYVLNVFFLLFLTSPLYLFWGRAFMIESSALFFAILSIYYCLLFVEKRTWQVCVLYMISASLGLLQKATTVLPVMLICGAGSVYVMQLYQIKNITRDRFLLSIKLFVMYIIPVLLLYCWVGYSDQVKMTSVQGVHLTSKALSVWNWGRLEQRISWDLWGGVVWSRLFVPNLGVGWIGGTVIAGSLFICPRERLNVIAASLAMGVGSLLLFSNLHIVHDYYQFSVLIFFIFPVAVIVSELMDAPKKRIAGSLLLLFFVVSGVNAFIFGYYREMSKSIYPDNRDVAIGNILKSETPVSSQFVAFGNDWSSTFAYISGRKGFTASRSFVDYHDISSAPDKYIDPGHLGAMVSCEDVLGNASTQNLFEWTEKNRGWKYATTHNCFIATPASDFSLKTRTSERCAGLIDKAKIENLHGVDFVAFEGWVAIKRDVYKIPGRVFLKVTGQKGEGSIFEMTRVPRLYVNDELKIDRYINSGFSGLLPSVLSPGDYVAEILIQDEHGIDCQISKKFKIQ